jgi:hypothetical protein
MLEWVRCGFNEDSILKGKEDTPMDTYLLQGQGEGETPNVSCDLYLRLLCLFSALMVCAFHAVTMEDSWRIRSFIASTGVEHSCSKKYVRVGNSASTFHTIEALYRLKLFQPLPDYRSCVYVFLSAWKSIH